MMSSLQFHEEKLKNKADWSGHTYPTAMAPGYDKIQFQRSETQFPNLSSMITNP